MSIVRRLYDINSDESDASGIQGQEERLGLLTNAAVDKSLPRIETGSSWYASVFIVVNAALGAGLLNFPAAYNQSGGVLVAVIVQAVLMVFIIGALLVLAYCSDVHQSATYQDTVYAMCGKWAQILCSITVILYCFGTCITFFIIIGDQWDSAFSFIIGEDYCLHWYFNRKFTMSITSLFLILPICFPRRIDFLKYASMLGVLGIVYCVVLMAVKYFMGPVHPGHIRTSPATWSDVFIVVPVICFGYQCHVSVIPIYACMKKRTLGEFTKTIVAAMIICVACYTVAAIFGYWTFGDAVASDVLDSYKLTKDNPQPEVLVGIIVIAGKMYTTYPILLFVGRAALDSVWIDLWRLPAETVVSQEKLRRVSSTLVWFFLSLVLAVVVPTIGDVISVLGGLAALFIFIFPGVCLLQLLLKGYINVVQNKYRYHILMTLAICYLIIGAFIFGVTTTQAIWEDIAKSTKPIKKLGPCGNQ